MRNGVRVAGQGRIEDGEGASAVTEQVPEADREEVAEQTAPGRQSTRQRHAIDAGVEPELADPRDIKDVDRASEPGRRDPAPDWRRPLLDRPTVRVGIYAWALVGAALLAWGAGMIFLRLEIVFVPFLIALFPAAVLSAPVTWLKQRLPDALAALLVLLGFIGLLSGIIAGLAPSVAAEFSGEGGIVAQAQTGADEIESFLAEGPFGLPPVRFGDLLQRAQDALANSEVGGNLLGAASVLVEGVTGVLLGLVVLFFYLKDGKKLARWARDLFPHRVRPDVEVIGGQAWQTVGGYIRGQLFVALVDAVLIGIGLVILRIPLALPLAVLVFIGGLFPIVGAFISGLLAVLVALATAGVTRALIVLAVILAVQQLEGHILAPTVFGRTVKLHPVAVLAALAGGGALLGVLGAFIAVPLAASASRAVGYIRERVPG